MQNEQLKPIHLAGNLKAKCLDIAMLNRVERLRLLSTWYEAAKKGELENYELVVFKIPYDSFFPIVNQQAIMEIEQLLQEKYPL